MTNFHDVGDFHRKFDLDSVTWRKAGPREWDQDLIEYRVKFLREELTEFETGCETRDHAQMADALIDLAYVVFGTAHLLGYPWDELWADVQRANMAKKRATTPEEMASTGRNSTFDVVKPPGWTPPQTDVILTRYGWKFDDD